MLGLQNKCLIRNSRLTEHNIRMVSLSLDMNSNCVPDCISQVAAIQEALPGVSTAAVRDALSRYHGVNRAMEHLLLLGTSN